MKTYLPRLHSTMLIGILLVLLSEQVHQLNANHHEQSTSDRQIQVGVGRIEITPEEPIRLSGYGGRQELPTGTAGQLWAKAIAMSDGQNSTLIVTLDLIGVPAWLKQEVIDKLGMPESQVAICASHTHSGPHLKNVLDPIFMADIPPNHWAGIERYSAALSDKVVKACRDALDNLQDCNLHWAQGEVGFAVNRRGLENGVWTGFGTQPDGPVDHALPVLKITNRDDELLALLTNYACHCTTLGGGFNEYHGDWAGEAQRLLEERHPGITAMVAIGCGADANPNPRGSMAEVQQHGLALANEVDRVIGESMTALKTVPQTRIDHITLPFDPLPTRDEWEAHANSEVKTNYYAKKMLEKLDRGENLPTSIEYPIQTWTFGEELAMVFLAGEVVVDYSIKLKERFDKDRLWVTAYANAIPSYIASRRLYDEGGYEVDRSMLYYDKPQRLAPDTEELVLDEVLKQLPFTFYSEDTLLRLPPPVEKDQALSTMQIHDDLQIELVATEPQVMDPIDIAWGPDGRMWVVEMADYPLGINDDGTPGGRVRVLEDKDQNGSYEHSTLFLENIPFPTSVFPWREGVLITTPPDVLYARDTNNDGRADTQESLYSGFYLGNEQHLVNGLQWGLDGWIYLANGDSGGVIRSTVQTSEPVNINNLDLRIHPETGRVETVLGRTQYGRNRDAWGNWFGNNNSWPGWHYALDDHYLQRNPHVVYPNHRIFLPKVPQAGPVYPISRTLSRYNDYEKSNRFTSACGYMIYEDTALGDDFIGNSFVAEPVHNLVSRAVLKADGATFYSRRAPEERSAEFLASTDNWFRPVAIRSGPDGALYVVDMYRLVIEHPEWVPLDWQRKLNLREGHDKGRIYRITQNGHKNRPTTNLTKLSNQQLVDALDTSNRWQRDAAQQLLHWRNASDVKEQLQSMLENSNYPEARAQSLWTLRGLSLLNAASIEKSLADTDPRVRRQAIKLSESFLNSNLEVLDAVLNQSTERDPFLRQQLAYSLGESNDPAAATLLGDLLLTNADDPLIRSAALSSLPTHLKWLAENRVSEILGSGNLPLIQGFLSTLIASGNQSAIAACLPVIFDDSTNFKTPTVFLESLRKRNQSLQTLYSQGSAGLRNGLETSKQPFERAERIAVDENSDLETRRAALSMMAYPQHNQPANRALLLDILSPDSPVELQQDTLTYLERNAGADFVEVLIEKWSSLGPSIRKEVLRTLLKRSNWTRSLLGQVEEHPSIRASFNTSQIVSLTSHQDPIIQNLATKVFKASVSNDRLQVLEKYQSALDLVGDPKRGRAVFTAQCTICHKVGDTGYHVGPDLTALSDKSPSSMLIGILDPNRAVEDKFSLYTLSTQSGTTGAGVIATETSNSITLLNAGGIEQTFLRSDIESLDGGTQSLMPEGLELGIDQQAMADLLAFLNQAGSSRVVERDEDGSYALTANLGAVEGPSAFYNPENSSIDYISEKDTVTWTVKNLKPGYYDIFSNAGLGIDYQGRPFTLSMNDTFVTGAVSYSRGMNHYRQRKFGNILIEQDLEVAEFRLQHQLDGPHLSLIELRLIPVP